MRIPRQGESLKIGRNVSTIEVAQFMAQLVQTLATGDPLTLDISRKLWHPMPDKFLQNCAQYIYSRAYFEPDPPTAQILRTPGATLRQARANCVDYTIFMAALASCAGLPVVIRIVKFQPDKNFTHVYPVIAGTPVDLVIGQRQDGTEYQRRQNINFVHFGEEVPHFAKFDTVV